MRIRPADAADSAAAVEVVRAVFDEYGFTWDECDYHADLYDLHSAYIAADKPFWIAEDGTGAPIGTVALDIFPLICAELGHTVRSDGQIRIGGCDCGLARLYVKPRARRSGLGSALMQTVLDEAKARDCKAMEIWSDKRFVEAHKLYGRFGAAVVGERICHDPDQSPEWGLLLQLI